MGSLEEDLGTDLTKKPTIDVVSHRISSIQKERREKKKEREHENESSD